MDYGERLKILRMRKKLSQQDVADRLNINRSTYARYELGQTQPDFETLEKLADFFDVSTDYILGRTDNPNPPGNDEDNLVAFYNLDDLDEEDIQYVKETIEFLRRKRRKQKNQK
ncbi:helix-turn-helix domain-containing protein [Caenibacillus caldisaponilyticus]|uniref:helix-turn-helix domain-containing protein n=1 Tax=Caenibacillus caldisaponilyticus TaxID=1674942 RepID=UPI0009883D74|nr:helix-turn-helix transcriptional regulator [Caenibacillus caldisaponilyticus]